MKKVIFPLTIIVLVFTACDILQEALKDTTIDPGRFINDNLWQRFNQKSPISTSFDDAIYEAGYLHDFEPEQIEYRPLDIQPKSSSGGYVLRSGVYSMNAKSFCLRGYTHGPSRGDGHLYAPLKGKKAGFIQTIIERYGEKPEIPQQNVQVLLWAIIAGADMNALGEQHSKTLNELFTIQELLEFQGKDWLNGIADEQINEFKRWAYNNASPKLRNLLEADDKIRAMVQQNKSFQEIEKVAIIAGAAPREDLIREVSKGRWSYHPDGFFVRFFPNGYPQTRVDVYVPFEGDLSFDAKGEPKLIGKNDLPKAKQVIFNPAISVAVPANQSSQKIGPSQNPVTPSPNLKIKFYAYPMGTEVIKSDGSSHTSLSGHIYVGFLVDDKLQVVKGFGPDGESYWESSSLSEETHLVRFAEKEFEVGVTPLSYNQAININKFGYFLGVNDCVSYADDVADMIGLNTPSFINAVATPMGFLEYLIDHN